MYNIYEFFIDYIDPMTGEEFHNVWIQISSHSQLIDAEIQMQRFIDSGIPAENLKIEHE